MGHLVGVHTGRRVEGAGRLVGVHTRRPVGVCAGRWVGESAARPGELHTGRWVEVNAAAIWRVYLERVNVYFIRLKRLGNHFVTDRKFMCCRLYT